MPLYRPTELAGRPLSWVQPETLRRHFRLIVDDQPAAMLDFFSMFSNAALATSSWGAWRLARRGLLRPLVFAHDTVTGCELATYRPHWTGTRGEISLASGHIFRWHVDNFWATHYTLADAVDSPLILFTKGLPDQGKRGVLKTQGQAFVQNRFYTDEEITLLLCLSWYLVVMHQQDSAAAAVS